MSAGIVSALGQNIQFLLVQLGLNPEGSEQGVENIVMGVGLGPPFGQAVLVDAVSPGESVGHPENKGDVRLFVRSDHIGQTVKKDSVLAERFPVVREIHQQGVPARVLLQELDRSMENIVGVGDRVVIGIHDQAVVAVLGGIAGALGDESALTLPMSMIWNSDDQNSLL